MFNTPTIILSLALVSLTTTASSQLRSRMPDSPTGRMAGALLDLADASDDALQSFLSERVAPDAPESVGTALKAYREQVEAPELLGAEKTGPDSATITLDSGGATYEMSYEVEADEPYRLVVFSFDSPER